ncbi:MAG TPA: acetate--CoA ligase family protein [Syntrophales bacterium]|nr:acetate--CoA ligase family protein [Syntrophales bacterium]
MNREQAVKILEGALGKGRKVLSEYESKQILKACGIPVTREVLVDHENDVPQAAAEIGYPLVMKGCSSEIAHKTEKGLIRVDIRTKAEAQAAFREIRHGMAGHAGGVLVQEMVKGRRELVMGMTRDSQFGPCVMFGLGGIFTEILRDIVFRKAPFDREDAEAMMQEIRARAILDAVRGMEAADRDRLADMLIRLGRIGLDFESVQEIDLNPVILSGKDPVVVDALIVLA